ncbi:MAG TPA: hydantoinase B/oxoprolinase family protein [Thermoleophilaceae bacterium]|nr:hydantoinase B/oxoprolinase family protein [Thermoleophilaceae bacterium]
MILGVDVGGTFTDAALLTGDRLVTGKSPTTPGDQSEGVMNAVHEALFAAGAAPGDVERFVHGMTVGTNALLEGRVARTALLATEGFTDLEELGRQARPDLYRLCAGHPPPLVPAELRVPVPERTGPEGVLRALDEDALRAALDGVEAEAAAVCLLWGFRHPEHERRAAELLDEALPGIHVSTSHETAGVFREYERCATTIVDAALSPLLRGYLGRLTERARDAGLPEPEVMLSSGGTADAGTAARHASWTVLSGPAGGAVGAAAMARGDAVGLDMGGTSCDVSLIVGDAAAVGTGREVGGRTLALPMVDVHTVGAGGGSIAWRDAGGALRVGPRSAGADPGPAAYGRGGEEPTVTDANLLLGHLDEDSPLAGGVRLDRAAAERAVGGLAEQLGLGLDETAAGIARVASAAMAQAVRVVTVERGIDPRELALVPFGGAGPLHAAQIADELGMRRVLVPVASGVLSAFGLVVAERRRDLVESVLLKASEASTGDVASVVERLARQGREELSAPDAELRATYDLRYEGQAFELQVPGEPEPDLDELRRAFDRAHEERYGYVDHDAGLELVSVRVAVAMPGAEPRPAAWDGLPDGAAEGPAVVPLPGSTLVVPEGWRARAQDDVVVMERKKGNPPSPASRRPRTRPLDPITLQVMLGSLRAACDEMGAVLVRSAHSANIKERRDASTALFDAEGQMVMQAEHIPVHLGAMPSAVAAVLDDEQRPGQSWILNDPYRGGTHLPDITVISPLFHEGELAGFAASRAHHADVGAEEPGSMPALSRTLADEGVVIAPTRLTDEVLHELAGRMRNPRQREADLRAQLAAGRAGGERVAALIERFGIETVRAGMRETLDYAERRTRARIAELEDGEREARDLLEAAEGDVQLQLQARVRGDAMELDFSGSAPQHDGNLNCPLAVTLSACYFALRVLTDPDVPPCSGAYRPLTVTAPEGSLLNARPPAAVAAGNVETSSRVADLVLRAFGHALGQGTMNNVTLGNERFTYYETLGGGQGACADADGPSAVHVAMSNTLNTPIEALELEFPLRAVEYSLRRGSGGAGRHRGGDGVVRELEALDEMRYSLITERRRHPPPGADGGEPGRPGRNLLNGEELEPKASGTLQPGDRLRIETPGGGGHGSE